MYALVLYRPEAADGGDRNDQDADPFDGMQVHSTYATDDEALAATERVVAPGRERGWAVWMAPVPEPAISPCVVCLQPSDTEHNACMKLLRDIRSQLGVVAAR